VALFAAMALGPAFAQQDPTLITGKTGLRDLTGRHQVRRDRAEAGIYLVQHEMSGGRHVLTFWQMGDPNLAHGYSDLAFVGEPVSVPCRLETLPARVKHTDVTTSDDNKLARVVKVEIKGENVVHEL
jgi:hypothetical protein